MWKYVIGGGLALAVVLLLYAAAIDLEPRLAGRDQNAAAVK